jgi:5-methyltetrahydrofolate--homocysteine methyltransferase
VGVCSELLSPERSAAFIQESRADDAVVRERHANKAKTKLVTLAEARANKVAIDWRHTTLSRPKVIGRRVFKNQDLSELAQAIDWTPYFQTWDLAGKYPAILKDEVVGAQAQSVFADAQAMLRKLIDGRWLQAHGAVSLLPANTVDDDTIEVYADESRREVLLRWTPLRTQSERPVVDGVRRPNRSLADYIAPKGQGDDHIGLFAVTAGIGADERARDFVAAGDDYNGILIKALADRLAEAFAEHLHRRVRTELWGYAADEALDLEALIAEKYRGIRPAPGYPACPDHSVKRAMFEVLRADEIGMGLTESMAMTPAASVSGFYLAHPDAVYFNVGAVGQDQLDDVARRQNLSVEALRRSLTHLLLTT